MTTNMNTDTNTNARAKKGFTLIEMLVTVSLFLIIITIAVGGFTNAIRTQRQVSSIISAESNVSITLEEMAREIRTGYLFCNGIGNETPTAGTNPNGAYADCGCVLSSAPAPAGSWTCTGLDFYDAESEHVVYARTANGSLTETVNSSTAQSLTGDTVNVKYLEFELYGQVEGDHWPPRVTIAIGIAPSSTDPAVQGDVVNLETTVSARSIDCDTATTPIQC